MRISKLKLRAKLILLFFLIGLIPLLITTSIAYQTANQQLSTEINSKFDIYTAEKQNLLETWFENQEKTVRIIASTQDIY